MIKLNRMITLIMSLLMLVTINACVFDQKQPPEIAVVEVTGHDHIEDNFTELCSEENIAHDPKLIAICQQQARRFYQDTIDGGANIFEPGCHRVYDNAACPAPGALFRASGDLCQSPTRLAEWTNAKCHPTKPVDSSKFDCDVQCKLKGANAGVCTTVKNFCAEGIDSAKCECVIL